MGGGSLATGGGFPACAVAEAKANEDRITRSRARMAGLSEAFLRVDMRRNFASRGNAAPSQAGVVTRANLSDK